MYLRDFPFLSFFLRGFGFFIIASLSSHLTLSFPPLLSSFFFQLNTVSSFIVATTCNVLEKDCAWKKDFGVEEERAVHSSACRANQDDFVCWCF